MRGEFKVRGGKLVAVELTVESEQLADVRISGDFFLEPDTALEELNQALIGMSTSANVSELTARMDQILASEVAMIGFSTEAVAIAVRRALGHATSWQDHTFEILHGPPMHPAMHVALDEVLPAEVAAGRRGPILRIWEWDAPLVVIGSFQSVKNEIDPIGLAKHDLMLVRRISGGGAMFMEAGNCITYSLVVPTSLVEGLSFERSYAYLDDWVMGALADVGINARYVPLNDIASEVGKIGGAAQKRFASGVVLHHVTMAYDIDATKMLEVLRIGREKLSDKGTRSANKRVDPMRSQTGMARADIIEAFIAHFAGRYPSVTSQYRPEELAQAEDLVKTKFLSQQWTYRVP